MNNCCQQESKSDFKKFCSDSMKEFNESFHGLDTQNRNSHLLTLLCESPNIEVSFQGLKRKLGWHQEILSRTLKRLEKDGIVFKTTSGSYKLITSPHFQNFQSHEMFQGGIPITQLWIPSNLNSNIIISKLKNTWFGNWRWYSYKETKSEKILTWISEEGNIWINLKIRDNAMFIEAGPVGIVGREKCIYSGYELLKRLMQIFNNKISEPNKILQHN